MSVLKGLECAYTLAPKSDCTLCFMQGHNSWFGSISIVFLRLIEQSVG